jgi:uncharacterized protein YdaU (DUF1376 family)
MSAKTDIWMPLYIGDYLSNTTHLTTEQSGAYLHLLMHYWKNGPLPNDDRILAQITRLPMDAWSIAQALLKSFFFLGEDGKLHQKRIDTEIEGWKAKKLKAKEKAEKGARAKWGKNAPSNAPSNASSTPQAMLNRCPSPSPTQEEKEGLAQEPDGITGQMVAKSLSDELGIGYRAQPGLAAACKTAIAKGADPSTLRDDMLGAWRDYKIAMPSLSWTYGSFEKFIAGDVWDAPASWPWKPGKSPPKRPTSKQEYVPSHLL